MSPLIDALPVGEYAAQAYARRFARTPMGVYFRLGDGRAKKVTGAEADNWIADARLRLERAEGERPRLGWWSLPGVIGASVAVIIVLSALQLAFLIGCALAALMLGPALFGLVRLWLVWRALLNETATRLADRPEIPMPLAGVLARNPFALVLPLAVLMALGTIAGLWIAGTMVDTHAAAAMEWPAEIVGAAALTAVMLVMLLAVVWDRMRRRR